MFPIQGFIIHQFFSLARDWSKRVSWPNIPQLKLGNIRDCYSTNCNTIQIWSWCSRYLSSVGNRYPALYVASYVGRKSEVKKCRQKDFKMLRVLLSICWIRKQLSAQSRGISSDFSRRGRRPRRLSIRRYSARFRRIINNYSTSARWIWDDR